MQKQIYILAVLLFSSSFMARAQLPATESPVCNAKFAQTLVEQQVMDTKSVVEPPKQIKILLRSADFLWKFDQPVARGYFAEAFKVADDRFKETGFESKKVGESKNILSHLPDPRMAVISAIAVKDAEWARRLTAQILAEFDKAAADRGTNNQPRKIGELLSLAAENARTNPDLSRYLYRRLMQYPLDSDWYFTLYQIAASDAAFADSIYAEVLANYRNETPRRLLFLSAYPFGNVRIFGVDKYTLGTSLPANFTASSTLQRQFIDVFFKRIANYTASEADLNRVSEQNYQAEPVYMVSALDDIEPDLSERFPDMLQRFTVAKTQANSVLREDMRKQLGERTKDTGELGQSFDDRIAALEKADGEGKLTDAMIVRLITWIEHTEEQFAKILPWLDKIQDEKGRPATVNYYWFLRANLAIKEKRFDNAAKFALKVPELEHRSLLMFDIAKEQLKNENDAANVFETLNGISKLTRSADNSVSKAQILLALTGMYDGVNHSVALDELGEAIRVINTLKDPDIFSTMVYREIQVKGMGFYAAFQTPGYNLEKTFEDISKKDFELSLANAMSLYDKYFRTLAVIAIANNCAKDAKPAPKPKAKP